MPPPHYTTPEGQPSIGETLIFPVRDSKGKDDIAREFIRERLIFGSKNLIAISGKD